ncbi:Amino acid ABC transporter, amino acid-binding/permease protein [Brochothrix campestris FSL F6-1037]|uniref:Amino acid ABC transporter, amino acid-binding/permease protein n=1 Tax=Brochothrix campestris FSL F6-1037 TaxID=1265861 RepID=W7CQC6_9LIST|nr:Amino acid ABC transporter, amino acid-binding/permease protein [Brochothrix campestris FSL F6-1037]
MKKLTKLTMLSLLLLIVTVIAMGCSNEKDSAQKTYTIATDVTFAPFEYKDKGEYVGIDMDLLQAIAKDQDFKVEIKPLGFNAAVQALESKQVDGVIAGMSITPERQAKFSFSDPYFDSGIVMAVADKDNTVKSYQDLKGKRVAIKTGTEGATFAESIKAKYGFKTVTFDDSANMYDDVKAGNSVAVFDDYPVLAYGVNEGNGLKIVTPKEKGNSYGFALNQTGNEELLKKFNKGLANLKASGKYDEIISTYLGETQSSASKQVTLDRDKTYTIATDTTFAPFEFVNKKGEFVGIDMDLVKAIAKDQNFMYEIKSVGFNSAVQALESNQVDAVIAGMSITPERKAKFAFSDPYFDSGVVMAVAEDDDQVTSYDDLKGKRVAVKTGTEGATFANSIKQKYDFTPVAFDDSDSMYNDVKTGNSVAVFDDYPVLAYGVKNGNGLKLVTDKEKGNSYGFAVGKNKNADLLTAFNTGLANIKTSGEYQKIQDTYLKTDKAETVAKDKTFFGLIKANYPDLMKGLGMTILLTAISLAIASVVGILFGFMRVSANPFVRWISIIYIDIFRGTPLIVQAFFIYFGVPTAFDFRLSAFAAGIITLSLNAGAYMAEIVRGGIQSVDSGQMEAARSLGLPYKTAMRRVIIPQAIRVMIPSFVNQFVMTLKDTSILSIIGIYELTQSGKIIIARDLESLKIWLIVGIMYFIVIMCLTKVSDFLERRMANGKVKR